MPFEKDFPDSFLEILQNSTLIQKKKMLDALKENITSMEDAIPLSKSNSSETAAAPPSRAPEDLVELIPNFVTDETLIKGLEEELKLLEIPSGNKPVSKWLTMIPHPYSFGKVNLKSQPLNDFPCFMQLMGLINTHNNDTDQMDACLVASYSNYRAAIGLHADDEDIHIDQSSSICNLSLGSSRTIQFCTKGSKPNDPPALSFELHTGSLTIMKPGCQQHLKHRVLKGQFGDKRRYCLSFRKLADSPMPLIPSIPNHDCSQSAPKIPVSPPQQETPKRPTIHKASLLLGDSITARLDADKLSKGKKKVINKSVGGYKIVDVDRALDELHNSNYLYENHTIIDQVFLCVGTNDIRHCKQNGVKHLKAPLFRLIKKIQGQFPMAKIHVQSLLPQKVMNSYTIRNVLNFNAILFNTCVHLRLYYINVFHIFLDSWKYTLNWGIFERDGIHPNKRGMGILARYYLFIIHNKQFNPLGW